MTIDLVLMHSAKEQAHKEKFALK